MTPQELFQQNLSIISRLYPQYPSMIASAPETGQFQILPGADSSYLCSTLETMADGTKVKNWIHGPNNPWQTAEQKIKESNWQSVDTFLVLRPSLGYVPFLLYPNLRKGRNAQRMLLVEDRIELFRQSLYLFDWTDILRSDRTILILHEEPMQAAINFFTTNPVSLLPVIQLMAGTCGGALEMKMLQLVSDEMKRLAETVHGASRQYFSELNTHYKSIANDPAHKTRVLLVEPEHDYLAESISDAFKEEQCETATFNCNQRILKFLNPYVWLVYTREHFPDVLLWMNRNTLSPIGYDNLKQLPIKKVLWFLDSPKRVETSREEIEATDAYFSFDASYLPYLKELSGKEGVYLPTAAGIHPLPDCAPDAQWQPRTGPDVGFMGALAAARFQDVRNFWLQRDPDFVVILDGIVEAYLADLAQCQENTGEYTYPLSLEERYNQSAGVERLPYSGFVVLYLEERATYLHRLRTVKLLKDFGLKTYGGAEWGQSEWAEELVSCYSGVMPGYKEDLPGVYYHTKININAFHVQCVNSTNPRVYDALAAGGFLLTEYRPAIEEEFEIGTHLVCFKNKQELQEKTAYYLEHEDEREAIARAGQKFVLQNATYPHRIRKILDVLANLSKV